MQRQTDWTKIALYGATGVVAIILGVLLSLLISGAASSDRSAQGDRFGGPFELVDGDGQKRTEKIFEGRVTLLYFGFAYCPDICPLELSNLAEAKRRMQDAGFAPQIVFISVDPERDTPELLKQYVEFFDPEIVGLTGSLEQVSATAKAYQVYFAKRPDPDEPEEYTVDHWAGVYAIGPKGELLHIFRGATEPQQIAETLLAKADEAGAISR